MFLSLSYKSQLTRLFLAFITGACGVFAFSPYDFWSISILSLSGLQILTLNRTSKQCVAIGFIWGLGLFSFGLYWISPTIVNFSGIATYKSIIILIIFNTYLSSYPAIFAGLLNNICINTNFLRLVLISPALWQCTEYLRGSIFTGFPWLQFGYSQIDGPLKGYAPLAGVEMVTFILMVIVGLIVLAIMNFNINSLFAAVIILILSWLLSYIPWHKYLTNQTIKVALIQGNIFQKANLTIEKPIKNEIIYAKISNILMGKIPIIIWPETAISELDFNQQIFLHRLNKKLIDNSSFLISGINECHIENNKNLNYNSIIVLGNKKIFNYHINNKYSKNHLVPFGEFIPLENFIFPLISFFKMPFPSFSRGKYIQAPLKIAGYNFTPVICYEIIFGEQIRANFRTNTNFLLTISNDIWFGNSIGSWQHFQIARMRALELGRSLLICTNNGITAIINASGKIEKILPQFTRSVLIHNIVPATGKTPYAHMGSWLIWMLTILNILIFMFFRFKNIIRYIT
ncbi:apolipoprotein N-acyltransferase [Candidatus Pantoea edessiphila]|uniref:Apolipoprotein N-acyltransferase n=1 Tax=Candidatus Pantoea edessiphila TaxID=2044610 RepID=A0A2P5T0D3_9GAMM|nr:apolipoprotein N-acyltransferase [Candidatus Pantoea edessiphila]PPI88047.1 apolipoprotein N-acyltransferase [Candidatus Pantoea edessiphila]